MWMLTSAANHQVMLTFIAVILFGARLDPIFLWTGQRKCQWQWLHLQILFDCLHIQRPFSPLTWSCLNSADTFTVAPKYDQFVPGLHCQILKHKKPNWIFECVMCKKIQCNMRLFSVYFTKHICGIVQSAHSADWALITVHSAAAWGEIIGGD